MNKSIIHKLSPFNNYSDMPAALLAVKKLLAFFICYVLGMIAGNILIMGVVFAGGKDPAQGGAFSDSVMELLGLYGTAAIIAVSILYWKLTEKRKLSEMGVTRHIGDWFIGALIGIGLLFVCIAAIMLTGSIKFNGISKTPDITMLVLLLGGYAVQGAAEEFLCRGAVFNSLKDKVSLPAAIAVNTVAFTVPHMDMLSSSEPMYILSGTLCLVVISCVFSFLTLRTESIWAACGLHTIWNFCLSSVLGLDLSGSEGASTAVLKMSSVGENLLNGGKYGIEASIIADLVIAAAALMLWHMYKRNNTERKA